MSAILLTQNSTFLFKYIVWVLGKVMEGIFNLLNVIGIPNVGLSIIFFTIFVNIVLLPLTYKQQKFSKLSMKMQPEIKAVQKKYEGKRDQDSQMKLNAEINAVYAKYGTSPTGSCLYLLIQLPIMIALYRVIYAMPAYVMKIREAFSPLVEKIAENSDAVELVKSFQTSAMFSSQFDNKKYELVNTLVDCLNRASTEDFGKISSTFSNLSGSVNQTMEKLHIYNNFLGLNTGNNPSFTIHEGWSSGNYLIVVGALMIPLLAGFTQWVSTKLMPQQPSTGDAQQDNMAASMKSMNTVMPLMSIFFCYTLPIGMGIYWVASSVVRSVIQIIINKKIDKMDFDELIKQNAEKSKQKMEKYAQQQEKMAAYANMKTKNISNPYNYSSKTIANADYKEVDTSSTTYKKAEPGSMMAKANLVREYNEKNKK